MASFDVNVVISDKFSRLTGLPSMQDVEFDKMDIVKSPGSIGEETTLTGLVDIAFDNMANAPTTQPPCICFPANPLARTELQRPV